MLISLSRVSFVALIFLSWNFGVLADGIAKDWLIDPSGYSARLERSSDAKEVTLTNGLISRTFFAGPNLATIDFRNLSTGESMIRAIRPEAMLTINGRSMNVGGLIGQKNQAYFTREEIGQMTADPQAMKFVGMSLGEPEAEFAWKRVRHHAPDAQWPPKGLSLRFDYEPSDFGTDAIAMGKVLWADDFSSQQTEWKMTASKAHERVSFFNEGKAGEIYAPYHVHCYADRNVPASARSFEAALDVGTDRATSWGIGMGLVFGDTVVKVNLRPGDRGKHGQFELREAGVEKLTSVKEFSDKDGGLSTEGAYRLRATLEPQVIRWEVAAQQMPLAWKLLFISNRPAGTVTSLRVGKMDRDGGNGDSTESSDIGRSKVQEVVVRGEPEATPVTTKPSSSLRVSVHYEMYNGLPLLVKWLTVANRGNETITVDKLTTEILAMPEFDNTGGPRGGVPLEEPDQLVVSTDYSFGGIFDRAQTNGHVVRYRNDKSFTSQVNYGLETPCLLEVSPDRGPAQDVKAGDTFRSYRTFELAVNGDRERRGLTYRRMMRTVAPWVTENPLMMHMRNADPIKVKEAVDQCAEVGFEMLILSFGSGFDAENDKPDYLMKWKEVADYARSKGVEIGCYSLYASRSVGGGNDIVPPKGRGNTFGTCPAITSQWGQGYIKKLSGLFPSTGFSVFEHDGPYPGDVDVTPRPPFQKGENDSQWVHWRIWSDFYRSLREQGVYINAPDYYFHQGSNKIGMGYREVNWSLPRAQQLIHTRQNIFDGTWERTPSMGWMFVPLSVYHGGGSAATIEPLDTHIDHYEQMILSNLAMGVQACYRGPRLFDTARVRDMIKRNVEWYKKHRTILEGDVIHLRRPDGRTLDGMLHVKPGADTPAMLCVFNPTDRELTETWSVPLYYSGLGGDVVAQDSSGKTTSGRTDRFSNVSQVLRVPPGRMLWISYRKGK